MIQSEEGSIMLDGEGKFDIIDRGYARDVITQECSYTFV